MKKFFKYLLAAIFPWLYFLYEDKNKQAAICFLLQLTIIGWLPCAIWACKNLSSKKIPKATKEVPQDEK